jgi:serine/threonine-protein kinase
MTPERWKLIKEVFEAASERDVAIRASFLDEACKGDSVLRSEVERLLSVQQPTGDFLEHPIARVLARVPDDATHSDFRAGRAPQMTIGLGSRIGSYEITALLGEGGMGRVWRAHHTALKRDDALKVLPDAFASDPERLARFRREAQVLASLNHPNIAHVYGLEQADGVQALVMELVDGPTLADRIAQGPIPLDEALPIARQVAEALEAAHERGIIHRDLKPANIKVKPDATVKVLDFGLAKALEPLFANATDATASPAITSPAMTEMGVILGTAAYMSPEQARGKAVDRRSDVWAFGCVLYEMLAGRRAFEGDNVSDTLASVLRGQPDWSALPQETPSAIRALLRRCLDRDPRERIADLGAALFVIKEQGTLEAEPGRGEPARTRWRWVAVVGSAALFVAAVATATVVWVATRPAAAALVTRTTLTTSGAAALNFRQGFARHLAITADGTRVVYGGTNQLLVRALDRLEPTALGGIGVPSGVFVSPDGQWVGFFDGNTALKKVSITGGPAVTLTGTDGTGPRGATWSEDGTIVYATSLPATGLLRVASAGGPPTVLTNPDRAGGEADHLWPEFLPGGQGVLFTIGAATGGPENAQVAVLDVRTGTYKTVLRGGQHAHYVSTGHLLYGAVNTLRAVPFDLGRLEVTGPPVPIIESVVTTSDGGLEMAVSVTGTLVYVSGRDIGTERLLAWVDRMGREEMLATPTRAYLYPRMAPDGSRVALDIRDQEQDIWIWDIARQTLTRLTFDPALDEYPVWTRDSRRIIFHSGREGVINLYWQAADGTGTVGRLTKSANPQAPYSISPDGTALVLREDSPQTRSDLLWLSLAPGSHVPRPLVQTMYREANGELAPNGRWLAYQSDESGRDEIYVRPFPDVSGGRWQVSTSGGRTPLWARTGRELFYRSLDGAVMGVQVQSGPGWRSGPPAQILPPRYYDGTGLIGRTFDISSDGQRFLMIKESGSQSESSQVVVVQNWFEELQRLVPTN